MKERILLVAASVFVTWAVLVPVTGSGESAQTPTQPAADIRELKLRDWEPRSMMVTKDFDRVSRKP